MIARTEPNSEAQRTSILEMKCFIAILIRMSILKISSIRDYRMEELKATYINKVFPRDRFLYLLKYFHICNNTDETTISSRTGKIQPIIDGFHVFSEAVKAGYNISIDESIIPFKGRSTMTIIIKTNLIRRVLECLWLHARGLVMCIIAYLMIDVSG